MANVPFLRIVSLGVLLLTLGCSSQGPGEAASVAGKVSYRGQPLTQGTIVFTPDPVRGPAGSPLRTLIQTDGTYHLKPADGQTLAGGWYRVTVAAVEMGPVEPGSAVLVPRSLLPAKFRDPELSGLACEIKPGKENTIHFNLE